MEKHKIFFDAEAKSMAKEFGTSEIPRCDYAVVKTNTTEGMEIFCSVTIVCHSCGTHLSKDLIIPVNARKTSETECLNCNSQIELFCKGIEKSDGCIYILRTSPCSAPHDTGPPPNIYNLKSFNHDTGGKIERMVTAIYTNAQNILGRDALSTLMFYSNGLFKLNTTINNRGNITVRYYISKWVKNKSAISVYSEFEEDKIQFLYETQSNGNLLEKNASLIFKKQRLGKKTRIKHQSKEARILLYLSILTIGVLLIAIIPRIPELQEKKKENRNAESIKHSNVIENRGESLIDSRDNKIYNTVKIGNQTWMVENIAYLPDVSLSMNGSEIDPHYYIYGYEGEDIQGGMTTVYYQNYGVLYNWPAAQIVCPDGWRLPSQQDWTILEENLGGAAIAGGKMKEMGTTYWISPNFNATNKSGFSGRPGGKRQSIGGFVSKYSEGYWWSTTEQTDFTGFYIYLISDKQNVASGSISKSNGLSVRCIKD